ncbi:hypothetical protein [Paraburkholderia unamae]|uniref:Uncharacterized protein n=1 Tax=Paraburkholderia unamae TaxID=219649 RepID=A0ABX5KT52_9BURK|nr:hypothetical protein [Paraburkholderia unamae]PVX84871.1 hypothetical protein C7402_104114 [Paraburkholderia unamae]
MEPEPASTQPSPSTFPALLSRLSFCLAWLFGLEAFLADDDPSHAGRPG